MQADFFVWYELEQMCSNFFHKLKMMRFGKEPLRPNSLMLERDFHTKTTIQLQ